MITRMPVVVLTLTVMSCANSGGPSTVGADVLWLPEGAVIQSDAAQPVRVLTGRSIYQDGTAAVAFVIRGDRNVVVSAIVDHFDRSGWERRRTQTLNPHLQTSFDSGFMPAQGGVLRPGETTEPPSLQWHGEWQSIAGENVVYMLTARGTEIRGYASYAPRSVPHRRPDL